MRTVTEKLYSPKSGDFLRRLARERIVPPAGRNDAEAVVLARIEDVLGNHEIFDLEHDRFVSQREVSDAITYLLALPLVNVPNVTAPDADLTPGVYELPTGEIYVVKKTRDGLRLYAKKLVEIKGERLTHADTVVKIEFEYVSGAIRSIHLEHRMSVARAEELTLRYGRCLNCGRALKAARSVRAGIGPICIKSFRLEG